MKYQLASYKKTISQILLYLFCLYFLIISSDEALEVCWHTFCQKISTKSSVTCNLPVQFSSRPTFLMLNIAFDIVLSTVCIKYTKWNSSFLAIQNIARISFVLLSLYVLICNFFCKNVIVLNMVIYFFILTSVSNSHFKFTQ